MQDQLKSVRFRESCFTLSSAVLVLVCCLPARGGEQYAGRVAACLDTLIEHGTDRYGPVQAPILVSILDVQTRQCPADPAPLDEAWRATRRGRRNPAGANLLPDQPTLETMFAMSDLLGEPKYADFARGYLSWYLANLVDDKGLPWWGWHRHYDVFLDQKTGHQGNHHEIHAIHDILWDRLWAVDPEATRRAIEAIWQWHVVDRQTGEINRHDDGQRGCDFAMSAGSMITAFAFLHEQTNESAWLDRARLLADYYWQRRDPRTNLIADRPNAGGDRFDGSHFVTADAGLFCHALLQSHEISSDASFRTQALAFLRAYHQYGYDAASGRFWGSLKLDGTPVPGPRLPAGDYAAYEPRGHLDIWQPYAAGYEHPLAAAQCYAQAYRLTGEDGMLEAARSFAAAIQAAWPPRTANADSWYRGYALQFAPQGTHAAGYGQALSFFIQLYVLTGEPPYLEQARAVADEAVAKLYANGLFRGHPAKPYYESLDGVGFLLYALLQLDVLLADPQQAVAQRTLWIGRGVERTPLPLENW